MGLIKKDISNLTLKCGYIISSTCFRKDAHLVSPKMEMVTKKVANRKIQEELRVRTKLKKKTFFSDNRHKEEGKKDTVIK